ncbi:death-associated inhibitor of apoptosis 1-like [Anopheles nili]|uniref:death-associated inhibitor of apoptosis 1-like n=1 Tax=Anopheles nili TaxID=185578 RepID=UPI00237C286A|nr:death-associated inhibitor of apoptosis 1-like [Anopheles nili]
MDIMSGRFSGITNNNTGPLTNDANDFNVEANRVRTYVHWPNSYVQPAELAKWGFVYTGHADSVICTFCRIELGYWERSDRPRDEHIRWSRQCPLLTGQSDNVPLEQNFLEQLPALEPIVSDVVGFDLDPVASRIDPEVEYVSTALDQEGNDDDDEVPHEKVCKICLVKPFSTVFLPCGHVAACGKCAASVNKCPICNTRLSNVKRIYFT